MNKYQYCGSSKPKFVLQC